MLFTQGEILRKIELRNDSSSDNARSLEDQGLPPESHLDPEMYDPELLTPGVDFSEGNPYTEESLQQFSSQVGWGARSRLIRGTLCDC